MKANIKNIIRMKKFFLVILLIPFQVFSQVPNSITKEEKVYGLSKIWKEVEYNFAYYDKIDVEKWDSLYLAMIKSVQETKNDFEYYKELQKFIAFLNDGHTGIVRFPKNVNRWRNVFKDYLIDFEWIEEKVIVTRVNVKKKKEIPIGSELIEVNGLTADEYLSQFVLPYTAASTEHAKKSKAVYYLLEGLKYSEYDIKIRTPENIIKSFKLVHDRFSKNKSSPEIYPPYKSEDNIQFHLLNDKVGYLVINSFWDSTVVLDFKKKLPELYKTQKLIIDLRENYGGNTSVGLDIFKYLTNDEKIYGEKIRGRKHFSENKALGARISSNDTADESWKKEAYLDYHNKLYTEFDYEPFINDLNTKKIVVPTLILIGHKTVSAAEDFLVFTKNQKHIQTMGETTNGSTGSPYFFSLPGGGKACICTLQSYLPDGSEFVGIGIYPDIEVKRTIKGIINLEDIVLDRALEYLDKK